MKNKALETILFHWRSALLLPEPPLWRQNRFKGKYSTTVTPTTGLYISCGRITAVMSGESRDDYSYGIVYLEFRVMTLSTISAAYALQWAAPGARHIYQLRQE